MNGTVNLKKLSHRQEGGNSYMGGEKQAVPQGGGQTCAGHDHDGCGCNYHFDARVTNNGRRSSLSSGKMGVRIIVRVCTDCTGPVVEVVILQS